MLFKRKHYRKLPADSEIFTDGGKKFARWVSAKGKIIVAPVNPKQTRAVFETLHWYIRLKNPATGRAIEVKAYRDKQASKIMETDLIRKLERGEVGLESSLNSTSNISIRDVLEKFEIYLEDCNNTPSHITKTVSRCSRILNLTNIKICKAIANLNIEAQLHELYKTGLSQSTVNGYFRAFRSFCNWLLRNKYIMSSPCKFVKCPKLKDSQIVHRRRSLEDCEVEKLIYAAKSSKQIVAGLCGLDRAMLYLVAVNTGFRASELSSLTPESFELAGQVPVVKCQSGYTKNKNDASIPIRHDIAKTLADWLLTKPANARVWSGKWAANRHGAKMIRHDLAVAGVEYRDSLGRVADFHALRHTFITNLVRAGVHPHNAQRLARHSTIDLTLNTYTHLEISDLANEVSKLGSSKTNSKPADNQFAPDAKSISEPFEPSSLSIISKNWNKLPDNIKAAINSLANID